MLSILIDEVTHQMKTVVIYLFFFFEKLRRVARTRLRVSEGVTDADGNSVVGRPTVIARLRGRSQGGTDGLVFR